MKKILISTTTPMAEELGLDSRQRKPIQNAQCLFLTPLDKKDSEVWETKYPHVQFVRNGPSPSYNCHGLTFGSRRTGIYEPEVISQILREDNYVEILRSEVKPGDVMIYVHSETGDFIHSGIVVGEIPFLLEHQDAGKMLVIISKWGKYKEMMHAANYCPYSPLGAKYYRLQG